MYDTILTKMIIPFSSIHKEREICVYLGHFTSLGIRIIHPRSPSSRRGEHDLSSADRESVSSSKRRLLINISSDDDGLAGNATAIPNAGIGSRWCTRNLQTLVLPCIRASVCTRTRAHNTRLISRGRRAEMREEKKGCGRGSVPLGHW